MPVTDDPRGRPVLAAPAYRHVPPPIAGAQPRDAVITALLARPRASVKWVHGPAGAGKTTVAALYAAARRASDPCHHSVWYSLTRDDADLGAFLADLAYRVFASRDSEPGEDAKWALADAVELCRADLDAALACWNRAVAPVLPGPCTVVLDDVHLLPDAGEVSASLPTLAAAMPKGCELLALGRRSPHSDWRGCSLFNLPPSALALSKAESDSLALACAPALRARELSRVHALSGGWVGYAALLATRLGAAPERLVGRFGARTAFLPASVADSAGVTAWQLSGRFATYVERDVLGGLATRDLECLTACAWLPEVDLGRSPLPAPARVVAEAVERLRQRSHLVTVLGSPDAAVYRIHPLLGEVLRHHIPSPSTRERLLRWQLRAARALERAGLPGEAVRLLHVAGESRELAAMLCRLGPALLHEGRGNSLLRWRTLLPTQDHELPSELRLVLAAAHAPHSPARAAQLFASVLEHPLGSRTATPDEQRCIRLEACAGLMQAVLVRLDMLHALDVPLDLVLGTETPDETLPWAALDGRLKVLTWLALVFRRPDHRELPAWSRAALQAIGTIADDDAGAETRMLAGIALGYMGQQCKAPSGAECAGGAAEARTRRPLARAARFNLDAARAACSADVERCRAAVASASQTAAVSGRRLFERSLRRALVTAELGAGNVAAARCALATLAQSDDQPGRLEGAGEQFLVGWCALLAGEIADARAAFELAESLAGKSGCVYYALLCRLGNAAGQFEAGDVAAARASLAHVRRAGRHIRNPLFAFTGLAIAADMALRGGRERAGRRLLRLWLSVARSFRLRHAALLTPGLLARLCAAAIRADVEVTTAGAMVRAHRLAPPACDEVKPGRSEGLGASVGRAPLAGDEDPLAAMRALGEACDVERDWPRPFELRCLGAFEALTRTDSGRAEALTLSPKPSSLLHALLGLGAVNVDADALVGLLWPGIPKVNSLKTLSTNVHRMRGYFGHEEVVVVRAHRVSLSARLCTVDALVFERAARSLLEGLQLRARHDAVGAAACRAMDRHLGDIFALCVGAYGGPLLPDATDAEVVRRRSVLRQLFVNAVLDYGGAREQAGASAEALDAYTRALRVEPAAESLYRRTMLALASVGQRHAALDVYERCEFELEAHLDRKPARGTRAVYERLVAGM